MPHPGASGYRNCYSSRRDVKEVAGWEHIHDRSTVLNTMSAHLAVTNGYPMMPTTGARCSHLEAYNYVNSLTYTAVNNLKMGYPATDDSTVLIRMRDTISVRPRYATWESSGMDLCADLRGTDNKVVIGRNEIMTIDTGTKLILPPHREGQIRSRSGLATHGIIVLNSPGTIDSDYEGYIHVVLMNLGARPFTLKHGDRIAQLVIAPIIRPLPLFIATEEDIQQLRPKPEIITGRPIKRVRINERGDGGFGSTGTHASNSDTNIESCISDSDLKQFI